MSIQDLDINLDGIATTKNSRNVNLLTINTESLPVSFPIIDTRKSFNEN